MSERWISTVAASQIDNKIWTEKHGHKRKVVSWTLTGGHYFRGRMLPGSVLLDLEGGGHIVRPENTPLITAFDYADTLGFDTAEVRAAAEEWVRTGKGVTFRLV
jgi:hypothetical protein